MFTYDLFFKRQDNKTLFMQLQHSSVNLGNYFTLKRHIVPEPIHTYLYATPYKYT